MKKTTILVCLIFLFASQSFAKTPWPPPSNPGDLKVTVVAAGSPQYLKDWVDPKMLNKVTIKRIHEVKVEQVAYCGFLITGLTPSSKAISTLQYSVGFKLYGPDRSLVFHEPNYTRGQIKDPKKPVYIMADPALDLVLEQSDPAGAYILEGIVTDLVSRKTATNTYTITLVK